MQEIPEHTKLPRTSQACYLKKTKKKNKWNSLCLLQCKTISVLLTVIVLTFEAMHVSPLGM